MPTNEKKYHHLYSPIPKKTLQDVHLNPSQGQTLRDWNGDHTQISIDNNSIRELFTPAHPRLADPATKFLNPFSSYDRLQLFFYDYLLSGIHPAKQLLASEATEWLMNALHQGAYLHAISGALAYYSAPKNIHFPKEVNNKESIQLNDRIAPVKECRINIVTTPTGFKLQEKVIYRAAYDLNIGANDNGLKLPDPDEDFVVATQGTFDFDFSKSFGEHFQLPRISLLSATISYGNAEIRECLDQRPFIDVVLDFFKQLFGIAEEKELNTQDEDHLLVARPN